MEPFNSVEIELSEIRSDQRRILDHHREFKDMFAAISHKLDSVKEMVHEKELQSKDRDREIQENCQDEIKSIYKAVAAFGVTSILTMAGSVVAYIANK